MDKELLENYQAMNIDVLTQKKIDLMEQIKEINKEYTPCKMLDVEDRYNRLKKRIKVAERKLKTLDSRIRNKERELAKRIELSENSDELLTAIYTLHNIIDN